MKKGLRKEDPLLPMVFNIVADMLTILLRAPRMMSKLKGWFLTLLVEDYLVFRTPDDTIHFMVMTLRKREI
jgi:hypothetical protein